MANTPFNIPAIKNLRHPAIEEPKMEDLPSQYQCIIKSGCYDLKFS